MLRFHQDRGAGATLAVLEIPVGGSQPLRRAAGRRRRSHHRFLEKPKDLPPGDQVFASMGIYIFDMSVLVPALEE